MRPRDAIRLAALVCVVALAAACSLFGRKSRPATWVIRAEGVAQIPAPPPSPRADGDRTLPWGAEVMRASATREVPEAGDEATPGVRRALARLEARAEARRALAVRVEALPAAPGATLAEFAATHEQVARALEAALRNAAESAEVEPGGTKLSIDLGMETRGLAEAVLAAGGGIPSAQTSVPTEDERIATAQRLATESVRAELLKKVREVPLRKDLTVGQRLLRDPIFGREAEKMMRSARIVDSGRRRDTWRIIAEVDVVPLLRWADENPDPTKRPSAGKK